MRLTSVTSAVSGKIRDVEPSPSKSEILGASQLPVNELDGDELSRNHNPNHCINTVRRRFFIERAVLAPFHSCPDLIYLNTAQIKAI
jgi:hypothetical protein